MKSRLLHQAHDQRTFAVVLETGDEAMACLQRFAEQERVFAAQVTAIGAFRHATVAFFDIESKTYEKHKIAEQTEVLSLIGDISEDPKGKPMLHIHAVLGRRDVSTVGGHLVEAHVRPTLEVIVTEQPAHLRRVHDENVGIALIRP